MQSDLVKEMRQEFTNAGAWCTAALLPEPNEHVARQFGWYWDLTEEVDWITQYLARVGRIVNVWDTPQFKAVEWLVGRSPLRFPVDLDSAIHGTFCRILSMEALCRNMATLSSIRAAQMTLSQVGDKLAKLADDILSIDEDVFELLSSACLPSGNPIHCLGEAQGAYSRSVGSCIGVLNARIEAQQSIHMNFLQTDVQRLKGRSPNWIAEYVAMMAADIYKTAFNVEKVIGERGERPSFEEFLDRFSRGYREAESSDKRKMARVMRKGGYHGNAFAPHS